jgi:hypothetical protein
MVFIWRGRAWTKKSILYKIIDVTVVLRKHRERRRRGRVTIMLQNRIPVL